MVAVPSRNEKHHQYAAAFLYVCILKGITDTVNFIVTPQTDHILDNILTLFKRRWLCHWTWSKKIWTVSCRLIVQTVCVQVMLYLSVLGACFHYNYVIMGTMASQITSLMIVYSIVFFRRRSKKTSMLRVTGLCGGGGIHREPVNSPHKWPVTRKCFHLMTSSCCILRLARRVINCSGSLCQVNSTNTRALEVSYKHLWLIISVCVCVSVTGSLGWRWQFIYFSVPSVYETHVR